MILTEPGLSVMIDPVKESRNASQRMTNYAIYRINETIRVLVFVSFSIIVFRFSLPRLRDPPVVHIYPKLSVAGDFAGS